MVSPSLMQAVDGGELGLRLGNGVTWSGVDRDSEDSILARAAAYPCYGDVPKKRPPSSWLEEGGTFSVLFPVCRAVTG